jgi:uncharacterized membrane protein YeaQ/YmgE (transglycosylase-associated protein family)
MTLLGFLMLLILGALCGAAAELIVGWSPGGFFASAAIGFVGALIGGWLAGLLHLPSMFVVHIDGRPIEVVWTVLGAIVLLLVVKLFRRSGTYVRRHG